MIPQETTTGVQTQYLEGDGRPTPNTQEDGILPGVETRQKITRQRIQRKRLRNTVRLQQGTPNTGQKNADSHWWSVLWREQPAFALTLVYITLGAAGSYFYFSLFEKFAINIFDYADVSDFLLVIFREPLVPALTLAAGLVIYLLARFDSWLDLRFPGYRNWSNGIERRFRRGMETTHRPLPVVEGVLALVIFLFVRHITPFCVRYRVREIRSGEQRGVIVILSGDNDGLPTLPPGLRIIGTTSRFVFFYDSVNKINHIVPVESITRITTLSQ